MVDGAAGMDSESLIGAWAKTATAACAGIYPQRIVFRGGGLYSAETESPGGFAIWDEGTFATAGDGFIEMSTANDAVVRYAVTVEGGTLTFIDREGCEVTYRRS